MKTMALLLILTGLWAGYHAAPGQESGRPWVSIPLQESPLTERYQLYEVEPGGGRLVVDVDGGGC